MSISDTGQNLAEKQCLINVDMEQQKQTDILEESVNDNEDTIPWSTRRLKYIINKTIVADLFWTWWLM